MSAISITIKIKGLKWVGAFSERDCCEGEVLLISLKILFSLVKSTTKVQQTQFIYRVSIFLGWGARSRGSGRSLILWKQENLPNLGYLFV